MNNKSADEIWRLFKKEQQNVGDALLKKVREEMMSHIQRFESRIEKVEQRLQILQEPLQKAKDPADTSNILGILSKIDEMVQLQTKHQKSLAYQDKLFDAFKKETGKFIEDLQADFTAKVDKQDSNLKGLIYQIEHPEISKEYPFAPGLYSNVRDWIDLRFDHCDTYQVFQMLKTIPEKAGEKELSLWEGVRRNAIQLLVANWPLATGPLFDPDTYFDAWADDNGENWVGMRHKMSREAHGVVRVVSVDGSIREASCYHGKWHGLVIGYIGEKVGIALYNSGERLSRFQFDKDFQELKGLDRRISTELNHLTSDHLNPAVHDPQPSDFQEPEPVADEVCEELRVKCIKGHAMDFIAGGIDLPTKDGGVECFFCLKKLTSIKSFQCTKCEDIFCYCAHCAVAFKEEYLMKKKLIMEQMSQTVKLQMQPSDNQLTRMRADGMSEVEDKSPRALSKNSSRRGTEKTKKETKKSFFGIFKK